MSENLETIEWRTKEVYVPTEYEALRRDVELDFRQWVGQQNNSINLNELDYFTDYYNTETIASSSKLTGHPLGEIALVYDPGTNKEQQEPQSLGPLSRIFDIQKQAQWWAMAHIRSARDLGSIMLTAHEALDAGIKEFEKQAKQQLVKVFSESTPDDQESLPITPKDFAGFHIRNLATRRLTSWRSQLTMHLRQNQTYLSFKTEPVLRNKGFRKPTKADGYLLKYFAVKSDEDNPTLPSEISTSNELSLETTERLNTLFAHGFDGYRAVADIFYGGNVMKTFKNLSAIARLIGQPLPEGIRSFNGMTTEMLSLKNALPKLVAKHSGFDGYVALANELYAGDATKTYQNLSAVAKMTGQEMPRQIQKFNGTSDEMMALRNSLSELVAKHSGFDGYVALANELYAGDATKTYQNLSAVAKMTGQEMPNNINAFQGTITEMVALKNALPELVATHSGFKGYVELANELYTGDATKTYQNLSAVAQMTEQEMPRGLKNFNGSTSEMLALRKALPRFAAEHIGFDGYIILADKLYGGDAFKTYNNLLAIAQMSDQTLPEGWRYFQGTTTEMRKQWRFISTNLFFDSYQQRFYPDQKQLKKAKQNYDALLGMN